MSTPTLAPTAPPCVDCGTTGGGMNGQIGKPSRARGLCNACYKRHKSRGSLGQFSRQGPRRDEVLDAWVELRDTETREAIAQRLGIARDTLDQHIIRARRDGDPRVAEPTGRAGAHRPHAEVELLGDMGWQARGECRNHEPELWFSLSAEGVAEAKAVCRDCPVRAECLDWAVANRPAGGIWGGEEFSDSGRVWNRRRSA